MNYQQPAGLAGKMKWLVTRYPQPPGKLIKLGSILTDPEDPETSLNRKSGLEAVPEEDTIDATAAVRQHIHSELSTNTSALLKIVPPNTPLYNAGLKAEGRTSQEVQTTVEAMNVIAEVFLPGKEYIDKALATPEVTAYVKTTKWAKSLYMIVGVATAGEITVTEEGSREKSFSTSAEGSAAGTEEAVEFSYQNKGQGGSTLKTDKATDFAYRVRQFEYWKVTGKFSDKGDVTDGTMFGDKRDDKGTFDDEIVPGFKRWDEEDIGTPDLFTISF
ncbi:hypothetical protein F5Y03DRAFT_365142 [Xylaria venustula]|nr:hypothetical protein F5Y03DRAFT_365142 [Xylaria venustula]